MEEYKVTFLNAEVAKIGLAPGDVLAVTIKSELVSESDLATLKDGMKNLFPDNKVMLFAIGQDDKVNFQVVTKEDISVKCESCKGCGG